MPKFSKKIKGEGRQEATDSSGLTREEREELERAKSSKLTSENNINSAGGIRKKTGRADSNR